MPHYLTKLMEVRSILLMSQLYVRASLARTESRAGHFRADYPERNDRKWLSQILVSGARIPLSCALSRCLWTDTGKGTRVLFGQFSFPTNTVDTLSR